MVYYCNSCKYKTNSNGNFYNHKLTFKHKKNAGEETIVIFYKLVNDEHPELLYIGSSFLPARYRWTGHKKCLNERKKTSKLHQAFAKYGVDKFHLEVLFERKCNTIEDKTKIEQTLIDLYKPNLNEVNAHAGIEYGLGEGEYARRYARTEKARLNGKKWAQSDRGKTKMKERRKKVYESKKFYCKICDKTGRDMYDLKIHESSMKHSRNELLGAYFCRLLQ